MSVAEADTFFHMILHPHPPPQPFECNEGTHGFRGSLPQDAKNKNHGPWRPHRRHQHLPVLPQLTALSGVHDGYPHHRQPHQHHHHQPVRNTLNNIKMAEKLPVWRLWAAVPHNIGPGFPGGNRPGRFANIIHSPVTS